MKRFSFRRLLASRWWVVAALLPPLLLATGCATPGTRARSRPAAFARLDATDRRLVLRGRVHDGMSKDAVFIAWGRPDVVSSAGAGKGPERVEVWLYQREITVYAPFNSYDTIYYRPTPWAGNGFAPYGGYGPLAHPRVIPIEVRTRKAVFRDGKLVRHGDWRGFPDW